MFCFDPLFRVVNGNFIKLRYQLYHLLNRLRSDYHVVVQGDPLKELALLPKAAQKFRMPSVTHSTVVNTYRFNLHLLFVFYSYDELGQGFSDFVAHIVLGKEQTIVKNLREDRYCKLFDAAAVICELPMCLLQQNILVYALHEVHVSDTSLRVPVERQLTQVVVE